MTEASLQINSFRQNVVYSGNMVQIRQIFYLITMKKGTDPLNPDKGVDINSYYYKFNDENVISQLELDIKDQITAYTPYRFTNVRCAAMKNKKGDYILHIFISMDDINEIYIISTNGNKSALDKISSAS